MSYFFKVPLTYLFIDWHCAENLVGERKLQKHFKRFTDIDKEYTLLFFRYVITLLSLFSTDFLKTCILI